MCQAAVHELEMTALELSMATSEVTALVMSVLVLEAIALAMNLVTHKAAVLVTESAILQHLVMKAAIFEGTPMMSMVIPRAVVLVLETFQLVVA